MDTYRKFFSISIERHYPDDAAMIIASTDRHYHIIARDTRFSFTSSNPLDRRLDFSAYFLAFIKALDERAESYEVIRTICLEIVTEYVRPKNRFQVWVKQLPARMIDTWWAKIFLKKFAKRVRQNENADGFIAEIITDQQATFGLGYGVDILECGICKLFKKHRFEKYASILCEVDAVTSSLAGLNLMRESTIAHGASKCDFRWSRKK